MLKKKIITQCLNCGRVINTTLNKIKHGRGKYCSTACRDIDPNHRKILGQLPHRKGFILFVSSGNRFDDPLLVPVKTRLVKNRNIKVLDLIIPAGDFSASYKITVDFLKNMSPPDLAIVPFDRIEVLAAAVALFQNNIKLCQIHAGDFSSVGSLDDDIRWAISTLCSIHMCNGPDAFWRVVKFLKLMGRPADNVFEVGSTAFDDTEPDTSLCPKLPYDLVLFLSPTKRLDLIDSEMNQIFSMLNKTTVWIEPSGKDVGDDKICMRLHWIKDGDFPQEITLYKSVPRMKFLGLIRNCQRFLGNSSSMIYEAPAYLKPEQIIHIGVRNQGREPVTIKIGGSDRIVKHLEDFVGGKS